MEEQGSSVRRVCMYKLKPTLEQERELEHALTLCRDVYNAAVGTRIFAPGWYRQAERALKTAQRRVSRRKRGGQRRRTAVVLLTKAHQKVRRQRQDFHHSVCWHGCPECGANLH